MSTTAPREVALSSQNLSRSFGTLKAVDNVCFDVHLGEVVGLLGPNGAGKTTTLRMLATLLKPSSGDALVGGYSVRDQPAAVKRSVGFVTSNTGLYGRLSARENLHYFGRLNGLEATGLEEAVHRVSRDFGLATFVDRRCSALSRGQAQRVSLARALLTDPEVLIVDEPTTGLDILAAQEVLAYFRMLADNGKAVLMSSHVMSEVELICDRVGVLHQGKLLAWGTHHELIGEFGGDSLTKAFLNAVSEAS